MSGVDNRVVAMDFDNAAFEKKLSDTIKSLDRLSETIKLTGVKQGLTDVSAAVNSFDTSHMAAGIENISSKFTALGAVGFTVIQSLTRTVLGFVSNLAHTAETDVLGPIITGGKQRSTNIEQAQFQFRGLGIDVDKAMKSALAAVQGTAFGLDEAAKIASQFGASGIQAGDQMTSALRGVAGAAAMTGSSFSEIGDIFAQSAATGVVNTQDLQQFATRGLNAAAAIAKQMGITEVKVREMASSGKLDFATFAKAMDGAFGAHATEANQTFTGSLANLHAAMSRLGASFETPKLQQERDLFNALSPTIDNFTKAIQPVIKAFIDVSKVGNDKLIGFLKHLDFSKYSASIANFAQIIRDSFSVITTVLDTVKVGFRQIFPSNTVKTLEGISKGFLLFIQALQPSKETIRELQKIFSGFFAIFDIGFAVVKGVISLIGDLVGHFSGAGEGVLRFGANLGDTLSVLDSMLVKGGGLNRFFAGLETSIDKFLDKVKKLLAEGGPVQKFFVDMKVRFYETEVAVLILKDRVVDFFQSFGGIEGPALVAIDRVHDRFEGLKRLLNFLQDLFDGVKTVLGKVLSYIGNWFKELGHNIAASLKPGDFNAAVDALNIGLLGGIVALLKKFVDGGLKLDIGGGLFGKIKDSLNQLTGVLKSMQAELKAEALLHIAEAIALLTASVVVLSLIDSARLTTAMTALAIGFGQLVATMKLLNDLTSGPTGAAKLIALAGAMEVLAGSAVILAGAVKIFASMNAEELARGLGGVSAALALMVGAVKLMEGDNSGMIAAGVAMTAMASAMVILAGAVKAFATMSWAELAKGLGAVAAGLGIIAAAMLIMPVSSTLAAGAAMIPLATGLAILAGAVKLFSTMSWEQLAKGMGALAVGLGIIAVAMNAMPITLPITAAGLVIVAAALNLMVPAIALLGSMKIGTLAKAMGALAVMLDLLAVGVNAMDEALPGAAALLVVSAALVVLAHVLKTLGDLKISELLTGFAAIAAMLLLLGGAALVLEPLIPALLGLGVALALVGGGFALFGVGAFLVAKAFEAMAAAGTAGVKAMITAITMFVQAMPTFITALVTSLEKGAGDILKAGGLLLKIMGVFLIQVLDTVIKLAPKIAQALLVIITEFLRLVREKFPDIVETAVEVLTTFLKAARDHISEFTQLAIDIMINFATTLKNNSQRLVDAAANLVVAFLTEIANHATDIVAAGLNILVKLIQGIGDNLVKIVDAVGTLIAKFITAVGDNELKIVDAGAHVLIKFIEGLGRDVAGVVKKAVDVVLAFLAALSNQALRLANGGADVLIHFLNGLADAIRTKAPEIRAAGLNIADAIIDGITGGILDKAKDVAKAAVKVAKDAFDAVKDWLFSHSPSKRFMKLGESMATGMALALDNDTTAENSAVANAERIVAAFQETVNKIPDSLEGIGAINPVISPVLDLTRVQEGARGLDKLLSTSPITPDVSLDQARLISATADTSNNGVLEPEAAVTKEVTFNQTNISPEALSTKDIYKNTKSQIAMAKEELNI